MNGDLNGLLATRLRLQAQLNLELASALVGKGQDELLKHFTDDAKVLLEAAKALRGEA